MNDTAVLSDCGMYRYTLTRTVGGLLWPITQEHPTVLWVMLNPSTADADTDDPTIRRCIGFTSDWGFHYMKVVNLYALRSTDPRNLWAADDPVGPDNNDHIEQAARTAALIVCAWGGNAKPDRVREVMDLLAPYSTKCLGTTGSGAPRHPLYLRRDAALRPFRHADLTRT